MQTLMRLVPAFVAIGLTGASRADSGTWRFALSTATITFPGGTAVANPGRLCILSGNAGIAIAFENGATTALLESETTSWATKLPAGTHTPAVQGFWSQRESRSREKGPH